MFKFPLKLFHLLESGKSDGKISECLDRTLFPSDLRSPFLISHLTGNGWTPHSQRWPCCAISFQSAWPAWSFALGWTWEIFFMNDPLREVFHLCPIHGTKGTKGCRLVHWLSHMWNLKRCNLISEYDSGLVVETPRISRLVWIVIPGNIQNMFLCSPLC